MNSSYKIKAALTVSVPEYVPLVDITGQIGVEPTSVLNAAEMRL